MIAAFLAMQAAAVPATTEAPAPAAEQPAATLIVPAGTPVRLVTTGAIDSRSAKQGQRFGLRLDEDVMGGPTVVIPRGSAAVGEGEAISDKGMFGKAARLVLEPLFIDFAGERVNLIGEKTNRGTDGTTAAAIVTLVTPLGLAITGKTATKPAGSVLEGRVRTDVALPVAPPSGG